MDTCLLSGSYSPKDVVFLLKELSGQITEQSNEFRERAIQSGVHYSEMLPIEYTPSKEYMDIFYETLEQHKTKLAELTVRLSRMLVEQRGENLVLVSLARAGTPIGILVKRCISLLYGLDLPHYSISIIRDRGIDENALNHILTKHPGTELQFIDGWTGKGIIQDTLIHACSTFEAKYGIHLDPRLAVLSDPAWCTSLSATKEDFLIPSACLNSTVSGLMSRTVLSRAMISETDFHGAKFYRELAGSDVSNFYIDTITTEFKEALQLKAAEQIPVRLPYKGLQDIHRIQSKFHIDDINLVKPGVGETTRVLLRRVPWKILVDSYDNYNLRHIMKLAKERNVPVEVYTDMSYSCCGIIKPKEFGDL